MFVTNHALAGAAIGALVRRPVPAFLAGVASHVLMDMAPHFGGLDVDGPEFLRAARVDGTVGLGVTAAIAAVAPPAMRRSALAGLAGACLIDLDSRAATSSAGPRSRPPSTGSTPASRTRFPTGTGPRPPPPQASPSPWAPPSATGAAGGAL